MTFDWSEHPEAAIELRESVWYYEDQEKFLGDRFAAAVEHSVDSVLDSLVQWSYYRQRQSTPQVFARSISGFLYKLIYMLRGREVVVVAYAHERRRPGYWKHRLND